MIAFTLLLMILNVVIGFDMMDTRPLISVGNFIWAALATIHLHFYFKEMVE